MDQNSGTRGMRNDQGNEDTTEAREHVHAAEENRDALEAQNRRTEATAPDSVDTPIGSGTNGMSATGTTRASDDPSQARENLRHAEENRDALAEQSRRVEASAPDDIDTGRR
ncbi:MAG TPA: hypothetical protein VFS20_29820 [Longimicrobium sp.]|nr:hypothetical protein [Longimicrobium sp.]